MAREYPLAFYNLDNNRDPAQVNKEIKGILNGWRPAVLGLCEAVDYKLPGVEDWRLVGRDTSRPGRENIAAYVKNNLEVSDVKWHDLKETWTRPKDPPNKHWPRSILEFRAGRLHVWVAHQPPQNTDNTQAAQQEGIDKLEARMAPWTRDDWDEKTQAQQDDAYEQARVVLWDANRKRTSKGPGPGMLQNRIAGWTAGGNIDCATWRGGDCKGAEDIAYPTKADGVPLKSDHGHAFRFTLVLFD